MKKKRAVAAVLATILLAACGRCFPPDINLERYATDREIVGAWNLISGTLVLARRDGYVPAVSAQHQVLFHADGTCDFSSLTGFTRTGEYLEAHGTWKLDHDTGMPSEKKRKNEVSVRLSDRGISLYLTEENGRLILWDFWGDPDSWEFIKYEKRGEP